MKKLSSLLLKIGIILLALGLFFSLCMSDVIRLYPELEEVPNGELVSFSETTTNFNKINAAVLVTDAPIVTEEDEFVYTYNGTSSGLVSKYVVNYNNKDYSVISYEDFTTSGGTFKTDKMKTFLETFTDDNGNEYYYGTVCLERTLWASMNFIQKTTITVAPFITVAIWLGVALIVASLVCAFIGNLQASGLGFGEFLGNTGKKYFRLILWFVMVALILAALYMLIVGVYTVFQFELQDCEIARTRSFFTTLVGSPLTAFFVLLAIAAVCVVLAVLLKKIIGKDALAHKATKMVSDNAIICGIILLSVFVRLNKDTFFSESNIRNLLSNTAVRFIIAAGVSGCLITKGTDLSAGRMTGFAACLAAIFLQRAGDYANKFYPSLGNLPIIPVLLGVVAICALLGAANGLVISKLKVPPFIATLGMQTLVYGACMVYTGSDPIGTLQTSYTSLAQGYFGNRMFSYIAIIALAVGLLMWFLYNKTRYGKYMYAIGGNEVAAEVAGINTSRSKVKIYALAAAMYALTGFLMAAKSGGASVNTASGYELEAIAGCTIGGVSVNGGVGKISGILVGVLVFELLKIALQWLGIPSEYTYVAQGLVIIVAVALDLRKYLAKK